LLVGATGWFPDDILDRLTWGDVCDLTDYWQDHPPVQWMLQHHWGYRRPAPELPPSADVPAGAIPQIPFKP
jgi:hypothetical protein